MQPAQADRIDDWRYCQAKNGREDVARATADQRRARLAGWRPPPNALARLLS